METTKTDLPLHDVILEIMFDGNEEKPVSFTPEDILWKIDNPEISEREIRMALEWLVRKRRVKYHVGKYTMDRYEFLDQKQKLTKNKTTQKRKGATKKTKTFFLNQQNKKKQISFHEVLFFIGILGLLALSYLYFNMQRDTIFNKDELLQTDITIPKVKLRKMYISKNSKSTEDLFKDVSTSFLRENNNNENLKKQVTALFKITDSIQDKNRLLILNLQKSIDNNISQSNIAYRRLVISNILFLSLFLILFIRKK